MGGSSGFQISRYNIYRLAGSWFSSSVGNLSAWIVVSMSISDPNNRMVDGASAPSRFERLIRFIFDGLQKKSLYL